MKILRRFLIGVLILMGVLLGISFLLPQKYRVERSRNINAPASKVFAQINNLRNWNNWDPMLEEEPELKYEYEGPAAGKKAKQMWHSEKDGNGDLTITESVPGQKIKYKYSYSDNAAKAVGQFLLEDAGGTRVTWTIEGDLGSNPLNKFLGLFLESKFGSRFEKGLERLELAVVEE